AQNWIEQAQKAAPLCLATSIAQFEGVAAQIKQLPLPEESFIPSSALGTQLKLLLAIRATRRAKQTASQNFEEMGSISKLYDRYNAALTKEKEKAPLHKQFLRLNEQEL